MVLVGTRLGRVAEGGDQKDNPEFISSLLSGSGAGGEEMTMGEKSPPHHRHTSLQGETTSKGSLHHHDEKRRS